MLDRIWTFSTALSLSRIVLTIPFTYAIVVDFPGHRWWAAGILLVAVVTDYLDGFLARRRHEVTDFGKIADPIADKVGVAAGVIALAWTGDLAWWIAAVVLARDVLILIGGISIRRRKNIIAQSNWPGKIAVGALAFLILLSILRLPGARLIEELTLGFTMVMITVSLILYAQRLFVGKKAGVS